MFPFYGLCLEKGGIAPGPHLVPAQEDAEFRRQEFGVEAPAAVVDAREQALRPAFPLELGVAVLSSPRIALAAV